MTAIDLKANINKVLFCFPLKGITTDASMRFAYTCLVPAECNSRAPKAISYLKSVSLQIS